MSTTPASDEYTPVLIVGGGLVGLSTALFLAQQGITPLLIERHPGTAIHPRLASMTARSMEIFRSVGSEAAIREVEPPFYEDSNLPMVESLVGEVFDYLMASDDFKAYFTKASPVQGSAIAQDVLEPVLRAQAEQAGAHLRFGTELVAFTQDDEGVTALIRERDSDDMLRSVRASFLIAADGGQSGIRQQLGIGRHFTEEPWHSLSIIFTSEADLMEEFHKRHIGMCFLANDTVSGALVAYPGSSVRPDLFRLDTPYDQEKESTADYPEERCLPLIRAAIGIPDYPVKVKTVLTYEAAIRVADRFQDGRVFLVGDAARVQPPSGALGGNTGIAEAHNLAWKLAAVLHGEAGHNLLTTYDMERRPLADYTAEQVNLLSHQRSEEGSAGITVNTLMLSLGYRYTAGAFISEANAEQLPLAQEPELWTGQPGTRAPHLVLERDGEHISTLDLYGRHWVLLTGPEGHAWREAGLHAAEQLHLPLDIHQVDATLRDVHGTFCSAYGIAPGGAVLVRPDGFIGWRSQETRDDADQVLTQALSRLLFRR